MKVPSKAWVKGGLWLAFFLLSPLLALRIYGHQLWYSGEAFASVVNEHLVITLFTLIVAALGVVINIRLGLVVFLAAQAALSAITANLARAKDKWEAPDFHPDFADTHTAYLGVAFQIMSYVCCGLLIAVVVSLFWKKSKAK